MSNVEFRTFSPQVHEYERHSQLGETLLLVAQKKQTLAATSPRDEVTIQIDQAVRNAEKVFLHKLNTYRDARGRVQWKRLIHNKSVLNGVLIRTAKELEKPVCNLESQDLRNKYISFMGSSLAGLFESVLPRKDALEYILKSAGVEMTVEGIQYAMKHNKHIHWDQVPGHTIRSLLEALGKQVNKRPSLLTSLDFRVPMEILQGKTLNPLYGSTVEKIRRSDTPEEDPIATILNKAGIGITIEDIQTIPSDKKILWNRISPQTYQEIIARATNIPFMFWTRQHFRKRYSFLNGRSLQGAEDYFKRRKKDKTVVEYYYYSIGNELRIEDIFAAITSHKKVWDSLPEKKRKELFDVITSKEQIFTEIENDNAFWKRVHPEVRLAIMHEASKEFGLPPPLWYPELLTKPLKILNGHSLKGLYEYTAEKERQAHPKGQPDIILAMLRDAGYTADSLPTRPAGRNFYAATETAKTRYHDHPILTREQEQTLFRYKYFDIPVSWIAYDRHFLESFGHADSINRKQIEFIVRDCQAIDYIIFLCNQRQLIKLARTFPPNRVSFEELIDAGRNGLMKAINKYDPTMGNKFITYSGYSAFKAMQMKVAESGYIIPIPTRIMDKQPQIRQLIEAFQTLYHSSPTRNEVRQIAIAITDLPVTTIDYVLDFIFIVRRQHEQSLNEPTLLNPKLEKESFVYDKTVDVPQAAITHLSRSEEPTATNSYDLSQLSPREQIVLRARGDLEMSNADVLAYQQMPMSEIHTLFESGLRKIRDTTRRSELPGTESISEDTGSEAVVVFDNSSETSVEKKRNAFTFTASLLEIGLISPAEIKKRQAFAKIVRQRGRNAFATEQSATIAQYLQTAPKKRIYDKFVSSNSPTGPFLVQ